MIYLKWTLGWAHYTALMLIKLIAILIAPIVAGPAIAYCSLTGREKLPRLWYIFDNHEEGFHCNRYQDILTSQHRMNYLLDGRSELFIALHWSLVRNPANNLRTLSFMYANLNDTVEEEVSYTSFRDYDGAGTEEGICKEYWSPFPKRIRATMGGNTTYYDVELLKIGKLYYPMIRRISVKLRKGLPVHTEIVLGFKTYRWMVHEAGALSEVDAHRMPTLQIARNRTDEEWA